MTYRTNAKLPAATLEQVLEFISRSTPQERSQIYSLLNSMRAEQIAEAKEEFKVGDRVVFNPNKRNAPYSVVGTLVEKRLKTFIVKPDDGGRNWKVTATLVRKAF